MHAGEFVTRAMGGVAVLVPGSLDVEKRTCDFIFSTGEQDRYGDIIDQKTWKLDPFKANPVFLWQHDREDLPIGMVTKIGPVGGNLTGTVQFHTNDENPFAEQVFKIVGKGGLRATSVGFRPGKATRIDPVGPGYGMLFSDCTLYEVSLVTIPGNAGALALSDDPTRPYSSEEEDGAQEKDQDMTTKDSPATTVDPNAGLVLVARGLLATFASLGANEENVLGVAQAIVQKAAKADALQARVTELESLAEQTKKAKEAEEKAAAHGVVVTRGIGEGKITPALEGWARSVGTKDLEAYLENAPVIVPKGALEEPQAKGAPDAASRTAADAIATGKKWEDLSSMQKHNLISDHPEIAKSMKAEADRRASAA